MEPVAGQRLGRYTLTRRLGAGGMAEVWEASDELLKRRVAVKIVRGALAESPEFSSRFLREARLAAQLQHANVVAVFDVGLERDALFVVMPVLAGGSLTERLARPVDDATALEWITALASALDYAHGKGVVHRDVKPLNVLFDEAGAPHLSDFGLAKGLDETTQLTQTGVILGTPLYMSPEQAMGTAAGPAADQYSLGILAYRLLAGRLPFEKDPTPVLLRKTAFEEMPPPSRFRPALSPVVDAVFARVLAKPAQGRFPSCGAFATALSAAVLRPAPRPTPSADGTTPPEAVPTMRTPRPVARALPEHRPPPPPPFPAEHAASPGRGAERRRIPPSTAFLLVPFALLLGFSLWVAFRPVATRAGAGGRPLPETTAGPAAANPLPVPASPAATSPAEPSPTPTATARPAETTLAIALPPPPRVTPTPRPAPAPAPAPSPAWTPRPQPYPSPTAAPIPTATPAPPRPTPTLPPRPPPTATSPAVPADPLAEVPRVAYPAGMRVKDAWVKVEKMGGHTLVFVFTDDLEGRGQSIGHFGTLSVPTRGDAPLAPDARSPLPLLCSGLDSSKVRCMVPAPSGSAAPRLGKGDRVFARAVLAGFSFSATLRVD